MFLRRAETVLENDPIGEEWEAWNPLERQVNFICTVFWLHEVSVVDWVLSDSVLARVYLSNESPTAVDISDLKKVA